MRPGHWLASLQYFDTDDEVAGRTSGPLKTALVARGTLPKCVQRRTG